MVEVSNNFIQECEANVGTYKFGKIKVNYIDDNPFNYEQGAYSSSNGAKIDAEQSIRYNKLVECEPNFKYKIELGNSAYKMKIVTYNANQAFIAVHDNLTDGNELTTESTAAYISVTIYSNDTLEGTSITLNNTIRNGEILGAELKGNTTQDGTPTPSSPVPVNNVTGEQVVRVCGKNLLDLSNMEIGTKNGITISKDNYGNITISGTATSYTAFNIPCNLSGENTYSCNNWGSFTLYMQYNGHGISGGSASANKTFNGNVDNLVIGINKNVIINKTIRLQVEKGTATTYEPYQGKDYEINLGKNLLQYSNFSNRTENGITITNNNDGTFLVNGTATADISLAIDSVNFMPMKGTWRMVGCPSGGSSSTYMLSAHVGYWGGGSPNIDIGNGTSITYTGNVKVRFYIKSGTTCNNLLFKPMVTYDLNATYEDFSPYFTPIELNKIGNYQDFIRKGTGKNLLDLSKIQVGKFVSADNVGSVLSLTNNSGWTTILDYIPCKQGDKFTMSRLETTPATQFLFVELDKDNIVLVRTNQSYIQDYHTYTIANANTKYLLVGYREDIAHTDIMLEKGNTKTFYEPFDYKDKWYIEKNVGKVVLNGSEEWYYYSATSKPVFYLTCEHYGINYKQQSGLICYSNYFLGKGQVYSFDNVYDLGNNVITFRTSYTRLVIRNDSITSVADFQSWLNTHNTSVYYVLNAPEYTLIENEELIEQLDALSHAETREGTTNITSSGMLPAILEVAPNLIESIRGKQTTPIVGYNITGDDDLINFKITSKADSNGNILGATSQSQVDIEIFNENNTHNLENKQVYISTGLNETEGNYCKWQPFTITQTKDTQTKNHTTYTGYDDMMRGNEAYIDNVDYGEEGVTLYDFTCKLAKEMGMALENTTMTNGEFIVKGNNFTNNEAKLVVLKNVAQMVGGFAMIDRDNLLRIVELSPEDAMAPIELTTNLYTEDFQNSAKFGEINEFAIGETNIETNAIVRSDDTSIAKNGIKKIEILDNMFLGLLEDKETAIEPLWDAFNGFSYYPFKTPYNGYPYIDLGDKVNITDINSNVYSTLVLNNVFEYNGGYKGNIGAEALSITAAKYKTNNTLGKQFRKVGIEIDRVEGKITSEIDAATDGITQAYNTAISQTEKNINLSVTEINKVLSGDPAVEGDTGLEGTVNKINQTYLTVNSNDFVVVSSTATEAKKKADAVDENTQKIVSQLHFDAETGLTISAEGSTDDDMKLNLTNSQVNFMYRNSPVLVINGNKIEFTGATFQKFDLGNYVWQAEDDDSLSLIYEGD